MQSYASAPCSLQLLCLRLTPTAPAPCYCPHPSHSPSHHLVCPHPSLLLPPHGSLHLTPIL